MDLARVDPPSSIPEPASVAPAAVGGAGTPQKPRIAVLDFDYATVATGVSAIFGTDVDIGKGMADLLVSHLVVKDGNYTVIARAQLETDPEGAELREQRPRRPKLRGAHRQAFGCGRHHRRQHHPVRQRHEGDRCWRCRWWSGSCRHRRRRAAEPSRRRRHLTIVNVENGEVVAVPEGLGESKRKSTTLTGGGDGWRGFSSGKVDLESTDFENTIIGEATKAAVEKISAEVIGRKALVAVRPATVEGLVTAIAGGRVIINIGSRGGLSVGDQITIVRTLELKEPRGNRCPPPQPRRLALFASSTSTPIPPSGRLSLAAAFRSRTSLRRSDRGSGAT